MRVVGVKELKNHLSEYIRIAGQGERVLVTNRDRVVAELVAPEAGRSLEVPDAVLADLVREGILTPALIRATEPPSTAPDVPITQLLVDLARDRGDR